MNSVLRYLKSRGVLTAAAPPGLSTPCWLWTGTRNDSGYGTLSWNGKTRLVHRLAYEASRGVIPEGRHLDHLCRIRHCFNPEHLEPKTPRGNVRSSPFTIASRNAAKTHCSKGHPFDATNTVIINAELGWRACRVCRQQKSRRYHAKQRSKK